MVSIRRVKFVVGLLDALPAGVRYQKALQLCIFTTAVRADGRIGVKNLLKQPIGDKCLF
jgi:hypothetical protein